MVCIAAFIILCVIGIFVAFLSIFNRDLGRKYLAVFKKSLGCVGKKVRLQKCETNFKDDVKNSLLSKVILKHPGWVKPLGTAIEVGSVLIVLVTVWSLIEALKALLALWVFGTCNVSQPEQCVLGAEVCSIDAKDPSNPAEYVGRWFSEWGEIFSNIPDRFRDWQAEDFLIEPYTYVEPYDANRSTALDIFDPGCIACLQSYRNQKSSGFFAEYNTVLLVYPITKPDGTYKFANSDLIARYYYATLLATQNPTSNSAQNAQSAPVSDQTASTATRLIDRLFTESNDQGISFQSVFQQLSADEAEQLLQTWLKDFGLSAKVIANIAATSTSDQVTQILADVASIVQDRINAKGIPTLIYNGKKHTGLYESH